MFLITGATGVIGRHAVDLLLGEGAEVAAVTRTPAAAALPAAARTVRGDASRPHTFETVLPDVEAVLISPRATGPGLPDLLRSAARHGVRRAVLLSAVTVGYPAGERRFADEFRHAEELVTGSDLGWTVLRLSDFAANSLAWAPQIKATGAVEGAFAAAATSPIDERDIAAVAVQALRTSEHLGATHTLTGPQSLDQAAKVRLIGDAVGRDLRFREVPPERVRRAMLDQGLPEEIPSRLLGSLADYAKVPGPTTATVAELLGRPARTFGAWARDHADAFRPISDH
ncbi:NAD(P)H-binding protein [Actinomadura sp. WMMB 499]|uniref:NAD(P)H-binding protein n=1 Tax=Actinomadura sp. WMMB 499 TaxID=1219491 RepID=UPI001248C5C6|nr:NAD(P)H-binding protein [Actinomadura sp. WMMB 499]QFG22068.1 NAD(P)H-binding protein [Actinomadura sp. WMMB 499]